MPVPESYRGNPLVWHCGKRKLTLGPQVSGDDEELRLHFNELEDNTQALYLFRRPLGTSMLPMLMLRVVVTMPCVLMVAVRA